MKTFIGTDRYEERKKQRFPSADELRIAANQAFLFENREELEKFEREYKGTEALYYAGQPSLTEMTSKIKEQIERL